MILDTAKRERKVVGHLVVTSNIAGKNTAQIKVINRSQKRWARFFLGTFRGEALLNKLPYLDIAPKETRFFHHLPRMLMEVRCEDVSQ